MFRQKRNFPDLSTSDVALVNADAPKGKASEEAQREKLLQRRQIKRHSQIQKIKQLSKIKPVVEGQNVSTVAEKG